MSDRDKAQSTFVFELCGGFISNFFLVSILTLSLFGCNLSSQGTANSSNDTISFSGSGAGCISTALPNLQNFFNAQSTDDQAAQTWSCLNGAVQTFEKYVRSSENSGDFTPHEFRSFIEKYFMGQLTISDRLLTEIMRLKQVLIGGTMDKISHNDLKRVEDFLSGIEKEARSLNSHMKVIVNVANPSAITANEIDVNFAESQIIESATHLGQLFKGSQAPYNISDFQTLMSELSLLYDQLGQHWSGPEYIIGKLGALANAKAFFLRPSAKSVAANEWTELFSTSAQLYGLWMRISYILNPIPYLTTGYGLAQLIQTMRKGFDIVQASMSRKANNEIEFEVFNNFLTTIFDVGIISNPKLLKSTFLNLAVPIFFKVYSPLKLGLRPIPSGIDTRIFNMMKDDFEGWAEMQMLYDKIALGLPSPQSAPSLAQLQVLWKSQTPIHAGPFQEISDFLNRKNPQQFNSNGTLIFEKNISGKSLDQAAFTGVNWRRIFVSALVRGYSEDPSFHYSGLTRDQFHQFYIDINQLGIDLHLLDPRATSIWSSLFLYSHLFLFSADTSSRLSFQQGMDVISYSMSAGKMSSRAYNDLAAICTNMKLDVYGLPMVNVDCYRKNFRQKFGYYFQELPRWVKASNYWTDEQWADFMVSIETLARVYGNSNEPMESVDLDNSANVFEYVESMFVLFDMDNSDTLNLSESMRFFPLIESSLAAASGIDDVTLNESIFTFIMKWGVAPTKDFFGLAKLFLWKLFKSNWGYEVDRIQMTKVLNALSNASGPALTPSRSLLAAPIGQKPMKARDPALSTMNISEPSMDSYIQQVFAKFSQVKDVKTLFSDPFEQRRLSDFEFEILKWSEPSRNYLTGN